eukprot:TRINITY_DN8562_c0_g1_i1.p1 TRINITY_DN8562_c0_g1~~TRINITY_DN8562_c0_g1_i1.p1  ORF type:complete len:165 (-),score=23.91 TRINITY_DN8562_c0_g1_i1:202-696(-)
MDCLQNSQDLPLHFAVKWDDFELIYKLLKSGETSTQQDNKGRTAIHIAVWENNHRALRQLCEFGDKRAIYIQDKNGDTPLHYATKICYRNCVNILMEFGAPLFIVNNDGLTPLHCAYPGQILSYVPYHKAVFLIHLKDKRNRTALDIAKKMQLWKYIVVYTRAS